MTIQEVVKKSEIFGKPFKISSHADDFYLILMGNEFRWYTPTTWNEGHSFFTKEDILSNEWEIKP